MTQVLWGGVRNDSAPSVVTVVGTQPGPVGGDGWAITHRLPTSALQANRHYAFIVTGHIRSITTSGASPNLGLAQVCLGDAAGTKHPHYRLQVGLGQQGTFPFQFLVLFYAGAGSPITDPLWGATWPNSVDLVLWARGFRNGDPTNYAARFEIADVTWLWFDLDAIPSTAVYAEEIFPSRSGAPLSSPQTLDLTLSSAPFTPAHTWMHWSNVWFEPSATAEVARVQTGQPSGGSIVPTKFEISTAARGPWSATATENPQQQLGGFWVETFASGFALRTLFAHGLQSTARLHRWRYFALRFELLTDAHSLVIDDSSPNTIFAAPIGERGSHVLGWEVPPRQFRVSDPIVLACGNAIANGTTPGNYAWVVHTNRDRVLWDSDSFVTVRSAQERVPMLAFGLHGGIGGDTEEVRFEFEALRPDRPAAGLEFVKGISLVTFWLLQDPDVSDPPIDPPGPPLILVPAREGLAVASQADPPIQPDGAIDESGTRPSHEIHGATGYTRSWPAMMVGRRQWTAQWSAVRETDRIALDAFLRSGISWRFRPPQDSGNVAVATVDAPQWQIVSPAGPVWSCSARILELVYLEP